MTLGNNGVGFGGRAGAEEVLFGARTGYERFCSLREPAMRGFRSPGKPGSFRFASAGDRQGAPVAAPLDPGLRPASPPLRGPFASSGFLTERRDAPSPARTRLFATSLSLVLKSLIRSAVLTASPPLAVIFSFYVGLAVAVSLRDCLCYQVGRQSGIRTPPSVSSAFYVECFIAMVFGIASDFRLSR